MAKHKRLYKTWLGVPVWMISGLSLFILSSAVYDYIVQDRSTIRYGLITATALILGISIGMNFVSVKFLVNQFKKQMGG